MNPERMLALLQCFEAEIEAAAQHLASKGRGGQHVSFHGDFAQVPPSGIGRLRWWAREFREAAQSKQVPEGG